MLQFMAKTFTQQEVVELLLKRQGRRLQRDFAASLGIHETALSAMYKLRIAPSKGVLKYLGLRAKKAALMYESIPK